MNAVAESPLILARGLSKIYQMGETEVHALRAVDFQVERGEFVAIIGQSGSGKSTLMHILGCLDTPTEGQIFIAGEDVSRYSESELAGIRNTTIGFVFQTFNLLPRFDLLRNIQLPMTYGGLSHRQRKKRARELLTRVGLGDRMDHRPNQLSGGQCQRAAIARALVTHPEIILADEPTGNLDSESGALILEMLHELHREGHTIILVTHEDRIADAAHRQIRLLDGRIIEDTGARLRPSLENQTMTQETPNPTPASPPPKKKRRKRRWLGRLLILALLIGGGWWIKQTFFGEKVDLMATLKEPIEVERGAIQESLLETGTVELKTTIEVKSSMSGKVKELLVEEGDAVKEGDVIAIIEPDPNEVLRLYQKRAAVESARLDLNDKRRELKRSIELHDRGVLPGDQFEKIQDAVTGSETNHRVALLELQALEREIDPAIEEANPEKGDDETDSVLSRLTDIRVLSPRSGIVIERLVEVGELVISGTATTVAGTTVVKLGDPAEAIVKASVNEVDISKIKSGQTVEITLNAYEETPFAAKVHRIAPIGIRPNGQGVVSFNVEIRFDQLDERVLPGMSCDLDIVIKQKKGALHLPYSAIFQEEKKLDDDAKELTSDIEYLDFVWMPDGDADWKKHPVTIGLKGAKRVEISEGLKEKDKVYPDAERLRWIKKEQQGPVTPTIDDEEA